MQQHVKQQFADLKNYVFGSTAAIITNISLIVGLGSAKAGKGPILGSLLTIALADNISDSLGIHVYKETEGNEERLSLLATILNFSARLFVSLTFIGIVLLFSRARSIPVAIAWGLLLLVILSWLINRTTKRNSLMEIIKHVAVAVVVIALSHSIGILITDWF
jgi:VIT1/CCC1 family predicted Fe2+/Mn2+ transporter